MIAKPLLASSRRAIVALLLCGAAAGAQTPDQSAPVPAAMLPDDPAQRLSNELRVLAGDPRDLAALDGAGRAALEIGDFNGALGFFGRAEQIAPQNGAAKAGLASALVQLEQPRRALPLFEEAVRLGVPVNAIAADRGLAFDLVGDTASAQRDYATALARSRDDETLRRYALSLGISGSRDKALDLLDPLVRRRDPAGWRARAFVLALTGDAPGADAIVAAMMPSQSRAMEPFMAELARLTPAQKAAAVNFGDMPAAGAGGGAAGGTILVRRDASPGAVTGAALVPAGAPFGRAASPATSLAAVQPSRPAPRPVQASVLQRAPAAPPVPQPAPPAPSLAQARPLPAAPTPVAVSPAAQIAQLPAAPARLVVSPPVEASGTPGLPSPAAASPASPMPSLAQAAPRPVVVAQSTALAVAPPAVVAGTDIPPQTSAVAAGSAAPLSTPSTSPAPIAPAAPRFARTATDGPPPAAFIGPPAPSPVAQVAIAPSSAVVPEPAPVAATVMPERLALAEPAPRAANEAAEWRASFGASRRPIEPAAAAATARPATPSKAGRSTADDIVHDRSAARGRIGRGRAVEAPGDAGKHDDTARHDDAAKGAKGGRGAVDKAPDRDEESAGDPEDRHGGVKGTKSRTDRSGKTAAAAASDRPARHGGKDADDDGKADGKTTAKARDRDGDDEASSGGRVYVQVAGGANKDDLPKAWAGVKKKAPDLLKGRTPSTTPLRFTNRLLVGPFKDEDEAQGFVNKLAGKGMSGTVFKSAKGQKIEKVPTAK